MKLQVTLEAGKNSPALVALNRRNRAYYQKQKSKIEALCARPDVLSAAVQRVESTTALLRAPTNASASLERLRSARSFEQEILDFDSVLSKAKIATAQSNRAKGSRIKIGSQRKPLREVIQDMISRPERRADSAAELWPHFFAELELLECSPRFARPDQSRDSITFTYYQLGGIDPIPRTISLLRFRQIVRELRSINGSPANG